MTPTTHPKRLEAREAIVEGAVKRERLGLVGRVAVLHVIGQRQVEELGAASLDEADTGVEHEQRQIGRIHIGRGAPDQCLDCVDAMLRAGAAIRLLGREADCPGAEVKAAPQHAAQLVLGGNRRRRDPGL